MSMECVNWYVDFFWYKWVISSLIFFFYKNDYLYKGIKNFVVVLIFVGWRRFIESIDMWSLCKFCQNFGKKICFGFYIEGGDNIFEDCCNKKNNKIIFLKIVN